MRLQPAGFGVQLLAIVAHALDQVQRLLAGDTVLDVKVADEAAGAADRYMEQVLHILPL